MIEDRLPFGANAQRLMNVARWYSANAAHVQLLPPTWMTLYELNKLPAERFRELLAEGVF